MIAFLKSKPGQYLLGALAALALLLAAYAYVDHRGYQRAEVYYKAEISSLKADYATAKTAEIERQNAANNAAKEREAARIAEIQEAADKLLNLQKELANEARQDPDAGKPVLGASSVQRINKVR